jgi:subtilisin family serine protease
MLRSVASLSIFLSVFLNSYAQSTDSGYVTDEIFIRFKDSVSEQEKDTFAQIHQLRKVRSFFITKAILFKIKSGTDASELANSLNENPIVKYADLNRIGYEPQSTGVNEPGFSYQWYLSGDFYGEKAETIKWKEAMELYSPKKDTVVAVVDSGIANFHPELEFKIAGMVAEQPSNGGISGRDDDGFGKVDDTHGWNFVSDFNKNEIGNFPEDDNGHGTLVSGIISSESNNNIGFTGVAPDSLILPLRVSDGKSISDLRIIEAIEYSVTANVKIVNVSMRFLSYLKYSLVLQEVAQNLHLDYDCLVICAAGNFEQNNDFVPTYPASYEGDAIISVAASDQNNELAKFSNFGLKSVDLAAPGVDIWGPTISRNQEPVFQEYFDFDLGQWLWGSTLYNQSNYFWNYFVDGYGKTWVTDSDYDSFYNLLNYAPYTDTFLKSPTIDLRNINFPELSVRVYHDLAYNWLLGSYDMLFFEISNDGTNWFKIGSVYGKTPYPGRTYSFDLSEFKDQLVEIRFRISTDGIYQSDGVYIDDFIITGTSPFNYTGNEYKADDGTSFAAPIVSGVAAMLLSHRPELSTQDVRKIILQSVTKVDGLADKVASGGIVNAYEAIKLADAWEIETEAPLFYTLSSSVSPTDAGSVSGTGSYEEGSTASLSAESADGYAFSHWSGDASGSSNPISITINQDMSIVANFSATDNSNSWSSSSNIGNNWKSFSWFGQFFEINSNWIYHLQLGWLYRHGDNLTSLWFYSFKHGWLFTSKNAFPYLFQHSKDSWIYLKDNQLYSWANQSWTAI